MQQTCNDLLPFLASFDPTVAAVDPVPLWLSDAAFAPVVVVVVVDSC